MTQTDAPAPRSAVTRLVVRTEPVDELAPLIPRADPRHPLLWMRRGEGIVGLGETLRIETSGANRVARRKRVRSQKGEKNEILSV